MNFGPETFPSLEAFSAESLCQERGNVVRHWTVKMVCGWGGVNWLLVLVHVQLHLVLLLDAISQETLSNAIYFHTERVTCLRHTEEGNHPSSPPSLIGLDRRNYHPPHTSRARRACLSAAQ